MIEKPKLNKWIEIYLDYIEEIGVEKHASEREGYKFKAVDTFQQNFNIDAPNLAENLEKSIEHNNLVAGNMYWPGKMLTIFATEYESETRAVLKLLFDEKKDIAERINKTQSIFDQLMDKRNQKLGENANSFIKLRFLSLLLGFHPSNEYPAIKPREWNIFCKYIDEDFKIPRGTSSGERYKILLDYINALNNKIKKISEIKKIKDVLTRGLEFNDPNYHWITQDVIFSTARVIVDEKDAKTIKEKPQVIMAKSQEDYEEEENQNMQFPLEAYLENFIIKNWNQINFGEPLSIYIDEEGTPAQQYPTTEGYIDILAKDKDDNFVVIELKRGRSKQEVVGQILGYVGWVKKNLAEKNQKVRGIIIVADGNQTLLDAVSTVSDFVSVKYYRLNFQFENPE